MTVTVTIRNASSAPLSWAGNCDYYSLVWVEYPDTAQPIPGLDATMQQAWALDTPAYENAPTVLGNYLQPSQPCTDGSTITEIPAGGARTLSFVWNGKTGDQPAIAGNMRVRAALSKVPEPIEAGFNVEVVESPLAVTPAKARTALAGNTAISSWTQSLPVGTKWQASTSELIRGKWKITAWPEAVLGQTGNPHATAWVDASTGSVDDVEIVPFRGATGPVPQTTTAGR